MDSTTLANFGSQIQPLPKWKPGFESESDELEDSEFEDAIELSGLAPLTGEPLEPLDSPSTTSAPKGAPTRAGRLPKPRKFYTDEQMLKLVALRFKSNS